MCRLLISFKALRAAVSAAPLASPLIGEAQGPFSLEVVMGSFEVFHAPTDYELPVLDHEDQAYEAGWYWWSCQPGCLPDSEPVGPFETAKEAEADAQAEADDTISWQRTSYVAAPLDEAEGV